MQLVVLAGGLGSRLRGAIPDGVPKPMAEVGGRPFLEHLLDRALAQDVDQVVLLVGHHASVISDHFGSTYRGASIAYSVESSPLGTGGAIRQAEDLLADSFVLLNGDTYVDVDLRGLQSLAGSEPLALSLTEVPDTGRYGAVEVADGRAVRLLEKGGHAPGLINAGVYACRRELIQRFPAQEAFSFETEVLEPLVPVLRPKYQRTGGTFFDIGIPEDYQAANRFFGAR